MTQLQVTDQVSERVLEVLVSGNLSVLTPAERVDYYQRLCESLGLNPLTKPFEFLTLNGKLVLYALKGATDQLRGIHGISISEPHISQQGDMYIVTVTAVDKAGRTDSDMGVVSVGRLSGENLANAMLKAITKAKRRVTLSICGLGMLDETEIEDIPDSAKRPPVQMPQPRQVETRLPQHLDAETGEVREVRFAEKNGAPFTDTPPAPSMWPAFWAKAAEVGYSEDQVRAFVNVDQESFDAMTRNDLQGVLRDLRAAANPQPAHV